MSVVSMTHYDSYQDDDLQVVIQSGGNIIIQKRFEQFGGQTIQVTSEEFQRIINIVKMHQTIKKGA